MSTPVPVTGRLASAQAVSALDARLRAYLQALPLAPERIDATLAELRRSLPAEQVTPEQAFAALHELIARPGDAPRGWPAELRSIPARIGARFGSPRVSVWGQAPRLASAPAIARRHMRPPKLDRSPWHRLRDFIVDAKPIAARWLAEFRGLRGSARLRQGALLALVAVPAFAATSYLATVLPHKGSTPLELAILGTGFLLFGWILVGFWSACAGFAVLMFGDRHAVNDARAARTPLPADARTAVVMPVCDEEVPRVFAGLKAVFESLVASGGGEGFDFFVLSDSRDPDTCVAEEVAWAELGQELGQELGAESRLFYRRRRTHAKRKNGNVADFCRRWGGDYRYMIVLDADSIMTGAALKRLVQIMEAHPEAGLVQTQPLAVNRITPIARIQQFALRTYGPLFGAGLHFWHLDNAHYWGHNAIIRVAPFMDHCSLPRLPGRRASAGDILSHDFVEAALLRRAGWAVYLAYDLTGSYEEMPPTLLDELKRDRRWCQGNFQHLRLLFSDRLNPAHRALFANGVMAYASALLWLLFLGLASTEAVIEALRVPEYFPEPGALFPQWPVWRPAWAISLFAATMVVLFLPKFLGLAVVLLRRQGRAFGGWGRLLASALLEIVFTMLVAPVRMLSHSRFVLVTLLGGNVRWNSQARGDIAIGWRRALRYHGPGMLLALVWGGVMLALAPGFAGWLAPVLLPLLIAPAITVYSSRAGLGQRLRALRLCLIPEEGRPPRVLRRLRRHEAAAAESAAVGFAQAAFDPAVNALHCAMTRHPARLAAPIAAHREDLIRRVLEEGPQALGNAEKSTLLADGAALQRLHAAFWWGREQGEAPPS